MAKHPRPLEFMSSCWGMLQGQQCIAGGGDDSGTNTVKCICILDRGEGGGGWEEEAVVVGHNQSMFLPGTLSAFEPEYLRASLRPVEDTSAYRQTSLMKV